MNKKIINEKLQKIFYECDKHILRLNSAATKMSPFMPLDSTKYSQLNEDEIEHIDQFLFRFAKLQDAMGQKLFKNIMLFLEEEVENKPFIDILNRMEKIGLLPSAQIWRELREDRNELAHNYEDDPEVTSEAINKLYKRREQLIAIYYSIKNYYFSAVSFTQK